MIRIHRQARRSGVVIDEILTGSAECLIHGIALMARSIAHPISFAGAEPPEFKG
jgi:hypothetical protein